MGKHLETSAGPSLMEQPLEDVAQELSVDHGHQMVLPGMEVLHGIVSPRQRSLPVELATMMQKLDCALMTLLLQWCLLFRLLSTSTNHNHNNNYNNNRDYNYNNYNHNNNFNFNHNHVNNNHNNYNHNHNNRTMYCPRQRSLLFTGNSWI